ncbi:hypothetical protein AAVH_18520 [Aphelenchoides avenae]|nr:hypothetical protein AAVH_18520 [Aphelenchus avenae]
MEPSGNVLGSESSPLAKQQSHTTIVLVRCVVGQERVVVIAEDRCVTLKSDEPNPERFHLYISASAASRHIDDLMRFKRLASGFDPHLTPEDSGKMKAELKGIMDRAEQPPEERTWTYGPNPDPLLQKITYQTVAGAGQQQSFIVAQAGHLAVAEQAKEYINDPNATRQAG